MAVFNAPSMSNRVQAALSEALSAHKSIQARLTIAQQTNRDYGEVVVRDLKSVLELTNTEPAELDVRVSRVRRTRDEISARLEECVKLTGLIGRELAVAEAKADEKQARQRSNGPRLNV